MAPKGKKQAGSPPKPSGAGSPEGTTAQRFERELQGLAAKAKTDDTRIAGQVFLCLRAAFVLGALGVAAAASQAALSPMYGAIPAAALHRVVLMIACFLGWAGNELLRSVLPAPAAHFIPVAAASFPFLQSQLGAFTASLGPWWGPLVTEGITLGPLTLLSAATVADLLEGVQLSALPGFIADAVPGIASWVLLKYSERMAASQLQALAGQSFVFTRVGLELALAGVYAVFAPSRWLLLAAPALMHTALLDPHVMTPAATAALNSTLAAEKWTLLERRESVTGYVSVLESLEMGFRVMRCDHSLLGGEWVRVRGQPAREPVYGVFVMLEAVRLMEREVPVPDEEAAALVVGLGIGTASSALVQHGIDTTVVEIDPVVHEFASKYFHLDENNPPVLADAVGYAAAQASGSDKRYDYIVHDVFTGGAEPVELFTREFLQDLSDLLKPDGSIAINYAGDFSQPAPRIIYKTISAVFPSCRIFREVPRNEEQERLWGSDFTNMVIYCRKTPGPVTFRQPGASDYLGSLTRERFLRPEHEIKPEEFLDGHEAEYLLMRNSTAGLVKQHEASAMGHWKIMRTVVPAKIWELW